MSDTFNPQSIPTIYTAMQVAGAVPALGRLLARKLQGEELLFVEDMVVTLEQVLGRTRPEIEKIINIFLSAGLLRVELRKDTKAMTFVRETLVTLEGFHQFLLDTRSGRVKRMIDLRLSQRDLRVLSAIVKHTKQLFFKTDQTIEVPISTLEDELEDKTTVKYEADALDEAKSFNLIKIDGRGESAKLIFVPDKLEKIVRYADALRKINAIDSKNQEEAA